MKNNQIIILALLGLGVYFLMNRGKGTTNSGPRQRTYTLPDGRKVTESQLPSLGYVLYQGQWYHQSQFPVPNNAPAGMTQSSPNWQQWLNTALSLGQQIVPMFTSNTGGGGLPSSGGDELPSGGGGDLSSGGGGGTGGW